MNMSNLQEESTLKVLDIIYALHGSDKDYPYEHLPYSVNKLGVVRLSKALKDALGKDLDKGLFIWARKNIPSLFA
jgi:hypothetical protein